MFESLNLIKPIWYFHLPSREQTSWPDPALVDSTNNLDIKYDSHKSAVLEGSFLMLMKGWLPKEDGSGQLSFSKMIYKPSINDEFRFIRKHFNPGWSIVFLLYWPFQYLDNRWMIDIIH